MPAPAVIAYLTDPDSNQPKDAATQHVADPGHALGEKLQVSLHHSKRLIWTYTSLK